MYKLTTQMILFMKYLLVRLVIAKYITFNRGIRSSFKIYRHHFYGFANLAFNAEQA